MPALKSFVQTATVVAAISSTAAGAPVHGARDAADSAAGPSLLSDPAAVTAPDNTQQAVAAAPISTVDYQWPTVTADQVLATVQQLQMPQPQGSIAPQAGINKDFDWQGELVKLAKATASSVEKESPVPLLGALGGLLIELFAPESSAEKNQKEWQEAVQNKLSNLEADIGQVQQTLTALTGLSTEVKMSVETEALRNTLQQMIESTAIINRAFNDFEV